MRLRTIKITAVFFAICISHADAQIYTCKDANGKIIYTDSPSQCANAEEVKVDSLPALVPTKPLASSGSKAVEDKNLYTELIITSPANDATIRDNQGALTINFRAAPALQTRKGHKYIVVVNGKEVYSGSSTIAALKNVDRGTQTIGVKVVDKDGNTKISADPVKVTLGRYSSLQNQENIFNDGDPDLDNDPDNNEAVDDAEQEDDIRKNSFSFPTNTKLPTRPPPPPPPSTN